MVCATVYKSRHSECLLLDLQMANLSRFDSVMCLFKFCNSLNLQIMLLNVLNTLFDFVG